MGDRCEELMPLGMQSIPDWDGSFNLSEVLATISLQQSMLHESITNGPPSVSNVVALPSKTPF